MSTLPAPAARRLRPLLCVGVCGSLVLVLGGVLLCFLHHPTYLFSAEALRTLTTPGAAAPESIPQLFVDAVRLRGHGLVLVGVLLLMSSPVLVLLQSVVLFARRREWTLVMLGTAIVVLLLLSTVIGRSAR